MDPEEKRIAVVMYDDADLMDIAGPVSVFNCAADQFVRSAGAAARPYRIDYLSPDGGFITTHQGLVLGSSAVKEVAPGDYDTIIVAGTHSTESPSVVRLAEWARRSRPAVRRLGSVCTGAFVLAYAGLLDGRRAATHWDDCDKLQAQFPAVKVDRDCIFIEDGGIWTSAGITAGIDLALAMVEEDFGHELALAVARRLVVFLKRPGGQSQFSAPLQSQSVEGPLAELLAWIVAHPDEDLRADTLAERANMSPRNFYRAFEEATGKSPGEWVEATRVEGAKRLLEQTGISIDQVALKAGFLTYERMRRTFARRMGVSPAAYRARFARPLRAVAGGFDLGLLETARTGKARPPQ